MPQATKFVFNEYVPTDSHSLAFNYTIVFDDGSEEKLSEHLSLPVELPEELDTVAPILETLHIAMGISYYKTFLPPVLDIPYGLEEEAATFWNTVYKNGLGEFLYKNNLSSDLIAKFIKTGNPTSPPIQRSVEPAAILGIGGGKDSILAGEMLQEIGIPVTGFVLGTKDHYGQAKAVADTMQVEFLGVERRIDPRIIELNKLPGAYNGHIPISAIFATVGTLLAILNNKKYVIVANEASASIPNLSWNGVEVNHQWSKSLEFEKAFQKYVQRYVAPDIAYFSAIRPLSSVAVCKLFVRYPKYFEVFTSDNSVFAIDSARRPEQRWSNNSPKSLSSFIMLAPWLAEEELLRIFGKNFLDDDSLEELFLALSGIEGHRPLDCVGTAQEIALSLNLLEQQGKFNNSALMRVARDRGAIREGDWQSELEDSLRLYPDEAFPPELRANLKDFYEKNLEVR